MIKNWLYSDSALDVDYWEKVDADTYAAIINDDSMDVADKVDSLLAADGYYYHQAWLEGDKVHYVAVATYEYGDFKKALDSINNEDDED